MPENGVQFCFGLTTSHSPISPGRHEFWIAGLGTRKRNRVDELIMRQKGNLPKLELLYPEYKFYFSRDVRSVRVFGEVLPGMGGEGVLVPGGFCLIHPRQSGGGYNKRRGWRWAPIIEGYGEGDDYCGAMSVLMVYTEGEFKGTVLVSFAFQKPEWYLDDSVVRLMKAV